MPLISLADQERLRAELAKKLEGPVRVELERHGRDANCTPCEQSEQLLREITAPSSTITLRTRLTTSELAPTIRLVGKARGHVRFLGVSGIRASKFDRSARGRFARADRFE